MKVGNITKAVTFKSFLLLSQKKQNKNKNAITFFVTVFFNILMKKNNDF